MSVRLCRYTALHFASQKMALALVKAGADVQCKNKDGYGSRAAFSCRCLSQFGAEGPSSRGGAMGVHGWLCRSTLLHNASLYGHTETAMALVKAGADVHCKTIYEGYGSFLGAASS